MANVLIGRRQVATLVAFLAAPFAAAGAFGASWTTAPKTSPAQGSGQAELYALTAACHSSYDRLVLRTRFGTPGYDVRYTTQVLSGPSGRPVSLQGTGRLRVRLSPADAHSAAGASLLPAVLTPHCPSLRQVKIVEDFEGITVLGLGISGTKAFQVFRLTTPTRIVIDIAH